MSFVRNVYHPGFDHVPVAQEREKARSVPAPVREPEPRRRVLRPVGELEADDIEADDIEAHALALADAAFQAARKALAGKVFAEPEVTIVVEKPKNYSLHKVTKAKYIFVPPGSNKRYQRFSNL